MEDAAPYCSVCACACVLFVGTGRTLKVQQIKFQSGSKGPKHLMCST